MDASQPWLILALAGYALAGVLCAFERLRGWHLHRSVRARLRALHGMPDGPITCAQGAVAARQSGPLASPVPFGRRAPYLLAPAPTGRAVLDHYAGQLGA